MDSISDFHPKTTDLRFAQAGIGGNAMGIPHFHAIATYAYRSSSHDGEHRSEIDGLHRTKEKRNMTAKPIHTILLISWILAAPIFATKAVGAEPLYAPALKPGDTVAIVTPAGPLNRKDDRADIARAKQLLEARGLKVRMSDDLFRETGYLAGPDETRIKELNAAIRDPTVRAIFPGRGGYGMTRIVDRIDFDALRKDPKVILGFSDITVLHMAAFRKTGLITFHSPNAVWGLGIDGGLQPPAKHYFWRALWSEEYASANGQLGYSICPFGWSTSFDAARFESESGLALPTTMTGGKATGRLVGGNLSLIAALMGTPYEIVTDENILFIEDVGEAPYSVDRMLSTLRLAGKFENLQGVLIGQFTLNAAQKVKPGETTTREVLLEYFQGLNIPVVDQFPSGHVKCNLTLPLGAMVELDADAHSVRLLENPVQVPSRQTVKRP